MTQNRPLTRGRSRVKVYHPRGGAHRLAAEMPILETRNILKNAANLAVQKGTSEHLNPCLF